MNHSFLNTTVKMVLNPLYRLQKLLNPLYRLQNKLTSFLWITVHRPLLCYLLCIIIKNIKMQDVEMHFVRHTDHGGSAGQCSLGASVEVINRERVAKWLLEMRADINPTCKIAT